MQTDFQKQNARLQKLPIILSVWTIGLILASLSNVHGQSTDPEQRVQSSLAVDAAPLVDGTATAWWDSSKQALRFPPATLLPNTEELLSERVGVPNDPPKPKAATNWNWLANVASFFDLTRIVIVLFCLLLIVAVAIVLFRSATFYVTLEKNKRLDRDRQEREITKVLELPFEVAPSEEGLLQASERFATHGEYNKAVIYLFSYVLIELDHGKAIVLRRGKTNRMYAKELRNSSQFLPHYTEVMETFERAFFGLHPITAEAYARCRHSADQVARAVAEQESLAISTSRIAKPSPTPATITLGVFLMLTSSVGCGTRLPTETYAGSRATTDSQSLAGFTAFRSIVNKSGRRTVTTNILSARLGKFSAIVWSPDNYATPNAKELAWINNWLSETPNSTFVYVGRDYNPGQFYWNQASENSEDFRKSAYLNRAAFRNSKYDSDFISDAMLDGSYARWFVSKSRFGSFQPRSLHSADESINLGNARPVMMVRSELLPITDFSSSELLKEFSNELADQADADVELLVESYARDVDSSTNSFWGDDYNEEEYEYDYEVYDKTQTEAYYNSTEDLEQSADRKNNPETDAEFEDIPSVDELSWERFEEINTEEEAKSYGQRFGSSSATDTATSKSRDRNVLAKVASAGTDSIRVVPLLSDDDDKALVFEVYNDENWEGSKVIVIANASLCCNYSLTDPASRLALQEIIERISPKGRVAFMNSSNPTLLQSHDNSNDSFGFQLLTVYPLNFIFIHLLFAGIVTLIALWPIFGRAQPLAAQNDRDFGRHVQALGQLLRRTSDRTFANSMVARYFREQRKEPHSPWANLDAPKENTKQAIVKTRDQNHSEEMSKS